MFRISTLTAAALATFYAAPAISQTVPLVYEETMDYPYSQGWYALHLEDETRSAHRIYVRGEGKRGGFTGGLHLDCGQPKYSRWEAQGGFLTTEDVPSQAILNIRQKFCK